MIAEAHILVGSGTEVIRLRVLLTSLNWSLPLRQLASTTNLIASQQPPQQSNSYHLDWVVPVTLLTLTMMTVFQ
jgi:hypothetical protein